MILLITQEGFNGRRFLFGPQRSFSHLWSKEGLEEEREKKKIDLRELQTHSGDKFLLIPQHILDKEVKARAQHHSALNLFLAIEPVASRLQDFGVVLVIRALSKLSLHPMSDAITVKFFKAKMDVCLTALKGCDLNNQGSKLPPGFISYLA